MKPRHLPYFVGTRITVRGRPGILNMMEKLPRSGELVYGVVYDEPRNGEPDRHWVQREELDT